MVGNSVTAFDAFAIGLLFLSGLLALTRGFVREALSITAFVAAALATIFTFQVFKVPLRQLITPGWAADAITVAGVFILVYMAVTLVTRNFSERLRGGSDVGVLDRSAGFIFGIVRGMALLGLALILFLQITPQESMPGWLVNARLYPAINATARALQSLAPSSAPVDDHLVKNDNTPAPASPAPSAAKTPAKSQNPETSANHGYNRSQRQSLDQLVNTTTEKANQGASATNKSKKP